MDAELKDIVGRTVQKGDRVVTSVGRGTASELRTGEVTALDKTPRGTFALVRYELKGWDGYVLKRSLWRGSRAGEGRLMDTIHFHPPKRGKDCLNCKHHAFERGVKCNHPSPPNAPVEVIRWAVGCPQHEHKETV